jgi:hypothetical protein
MVSLFISAEPLEFFSSDIDLVDATTSLIKGGE